MSYRLGIVLSGGGARGIAHIGVLRALEEHGFEIECLAGTSSGAIVAAFYAAGCSTDETLEFFETKSPFRLSRLAVTKPGIIDTAKVRRDMLEYLPCDAFEELPKRLFVAATDILNGRPVTFESGPLVCAILASASMPGVFTPTEIDGRWYADGGIVNNFPIEPLQGLCDVIVGVYTSTPRTVRAAELSSAFAVVQRAMEVGIYSVSKAKLSECDVLICPKDANRYTAFDTKHVREIYDVGYQAGVEHVEAIERALAAVV